MKPEHNQIMAEHGPSGEKHDVVILLVDDEKLLRELLTEFLQESGFTVRTAVNGADALEVYRARTCAVNLVITDLDMPHMGGESLYGHLIKIDPDVKVIVSTGLLDRRTEEHLLAMGVCGVLRKPYNLAVMRDEIIKVLNL